MRSSINSIKAGSNLQIGGTSSVTKANNNFVSKQTKFNIFHQFGIYTEKIFSKQALSQKELAEAKKAGSFLKYYDNGDVYFGQMDIDKPHGQGIYIFWSSALDLKPYFYRGGMDAGYFNGFGKFCKVVNDKESMYCYQGQWKANKKQGQGKENYNIQNTIFYKGMYSNDQRKGQGALFTPQGVFEGNWNNGTMNGEGMATIEKQTFKIIISGNWINDDIKQGRIQYIIKSNNTLIAEYKGEIKNLLRHGMGSYLTGSCRIEGQFVQDQPIGPIIIKSSNSSYNLNIPALDPTQEYLENIEGQIIYSNQDRYIGNIQITEDGTVKRTKGKYIYGNGKQLAGQFQDNDKGIPNLK